jgi:adenosylhomocysteine nucleosidase
MTLAIVSAMREELRALLPLLAGARVQRCAGRDFHVGELAGRPAVLVLSGIGKVAAAATAALAIDRFHARSVLFTGVAGGLGAGVGVGDVVVADALLQHDLDVSPLFPRWEVPLTGRARFATEVSRRALLEQAALEVLRAPHPMLAGFGLSATRLHTGLVISGDRFVSSAAESQALRAALPDALAVEMEGAAMAQVCADFDVPLVVMRTISDRADDTAHVDFGRFVAEVAAEYTRDIVHAALARGLA